MVPGWTTRYLPYSMGHDLAKVEKMQELVGALPQKVTFPVRAVSYMGGLGSHFSWLLGQSDR